MIGPVKQLPPGNGGARRKRKRVQDLSSDEESGIKHVCVLLLCWKWNVSYMLTADETGGAQMPKSNTSPPKRRKKLVTKMYVDDEGAMGELLSTVYHKITICYLDLDSSETFSAQISSSKTLPRPWIYISHTLLFFLPSVVSSCYPFILLWNTLVSNISSFFSVTEKVWESASEEETPSATTTITSDKDAELPQKSRQEKSSPVKASKGAKQSSLMSFFKK